MIVGAAAVELRIHGSHSLKERRGVLRSIVRRVRNRFNVSVAEVGGGDTWQVALLGIALAASDARMARKGLAQVIEFIEGLALAEVVDSDIEILRLPYEGFESAQEPESDGEEDES